MRTAIVLPVSRMEHVDSVFTRLEMLDCDEKTTDLIVSIHGNKQLQDEVHRRVEGSRFDYRMTVNYNPQKRTKREYSAVYRRQDIANIHNLLRSMVKPDVQWVFGIEDDTVFPGNALQRLQRIATGANVGVVSGVQVGRWGIPYVGGWLADDVYDPSELTTVPENRIGEVEAVDASGLFCFMVRAELYREHEFRPYQTVLGADVEFGLSLRRQGLQNYLDWQVLCGHITRDGSIIYPNKNIRVIQYEKRKDKWRFNSL